MSQVQQIDQEEEDREQIRRRITRQAPFDGGFATAYALLLLVDEVKALGGTIMRLGRWGHQ